MPRPISDEELQLKKRARRRLVGAIVLVTAVAVILPMVLDSEPRRVTQNVDIQIPSPDSGAFKPKSAAPATGAPPSQPSAAAPSQAAAGPQPLPASRDSAPLHGMPQGSTAAAKEAGPRPEATGVGAESKSSTNDAKAAARDGATAGGAYVVQVAALADAARVKQLQKQMSAAGIKAFTESINTKSGEITRVRAGPYATKEAAESARTRLKKAGLDGKVVPR